jgi:hypothetical protein
MGLILFWRGMTLKKAVSSLLILLILCVTFQPTLADKQIDIHVYIDGQKVMFDTNPTNVKGRLLVPVRSIFEALGVTVSWDSLKGEIRAEKGKTKIIMHVNHNRAQVNEEEITLDVPAMVLNNRVLVPLRFISEALETKVEYSSTYDVNHLIHIFTPQYEDYIIANGNSKELVLEKWSQYRPLYKGSMKEIYDVKPSVTDPSNLQAGRLKDEFMQDGLRMTNFIRALTGLPDNVKLNEEANIEAQHGAVLLDYMNDFTHHPLKPDEVNSEFFEIAYEGTRRSNLNYSWGDGVGTYTILPITVLDYMQDYGDHNRKRVGHRNAILRPGLKEIGFGKSGSITAMHHTNYDSQAKLESDYISFPSAGYFPNVLTTNEMGYTWDLPWEVKFNDQKYDTSSLIEVKVEITNLLNDEKLVLTRESKDRFYLHFDRVIFYPGGSFIKMYPGSLYNIKVSGLKKIDGTITSVDYRVFFFDDESFNILR